MGILYFFLCNSSWQQRLSLWFEMGPYSQFEQHSFFLLSFWVVYAVHGVFYTLTEKTFFATLSLTFRGDEAGPFHANSVISSCGLCFGKCFFDRI